MLAPVFTPENVDELVRRATHLTKARTKELAVSVQPKQVPADGLRKLPTPRPAAAPEIRAEAPGGPSPVMVLGVPEPTAPTPLALPVPAAPAPRPPDRSRLEPVAEDRWQWRIGISGERKDHVDPAMETGSSTVADLTTRCRPHNLYRAMLRYGRAYVERRIEEERCSREARRNHETPSGSGTLCEPVAPWRSWFAGAIWGVKPPPPLDT